MTPKEMHLLLAEFQKKRMPVFISSDGIDIAFETTIHRIEGNELFLENKVKPEFIRKFSNGHRFFLQCQRVRLQSTMVIPHGPWMSFLIQENSVIEETRQAERFMFTEEERVVAEITNPYDGTTKIHRHVMDMSATGLSMRMNVASRLFSPGTRLPELRVVIGGKPYTKSSGEVVYCRKFMDMMGRLRVQVGVKFLNAPGQSSPPRR